MLLAAIGDCDGNASALKVVLDLLAEEGILTIFQTGNLAGPAGVDAVSTLLEEYGVLVCQGERDRLLVRFEQKADTFRRKMEPEEFNVLAASHAALSSGGLEYLRGLHKRVERSIDGISISRLQRHRESSGAALILCGGAPEPFHRWVDGTLFVGPGRLVSSEGKAQYTLVDTDTTPWSVEIVRV
jgi:predicted phosphodiesterase